VASRYDAGVNTTDDVAEPTAGIESIWRGDRLIAYIIRAGVASAETSFFTGDDAAFQAGFVVYPAGGAVVPHVHLPIERKVVGTSELLMVRRGRCIVDLYGEDQVFVASRELVTGDTVLLIEGGHGFRMIDDTVLFEVKQGPYGGQAEKVRFDAPGEPAAE
jgi:hypothetical protein